MAKQVKPVSSTVFSDGIKIDDSDRIYFTDYEHNAITRLNQDSSLEVIAYDERISWPDAIAFDSDGVLYFTVAKFHQLYGGEGGTDISSPPFEVFRISLRN